MGSMSPITRSVSIFTRARSGPCCARRMYGPAAMDNAKLRREIFMRISYITRWLLDAGRRTGLRHRQQLLILLRTRRPRLMVSGVPAIGILQAGLERRELHFENPRHLADVLRDGREIEVF